MTGAEGTEPQAWVGCLACYNAGELVGEWVDGVEAGEVEQDPAAYGLTAHASGGSKAHHEEWWVFDHEGYAGLLDGECSPARAQELAELLGELPEGERAAFAAWADYFGVDEATAEKFREAYAGEWADVEEFAAELIEDTGVLGNAPEFLARYFDMSAYARDLVLGGDVFTEPASAGRVYVFWTVSDDIRAGLVRDAAGNEPGATS